MLYNIFLLSSQHLLHLDRFLTFFLSRASAMAIKSSVSNPGDAILSLWTGKVNWCIAWQCVESTIFISCIMMHDMKIVRMKHCMMHDGELMHCKVNWCIAWQGELMHCMTVCGEHYLHIMHHDAWHEDSAHEALHDAWQWTDALQGELMHCMTRWTDALHDSVWRALPSCHASCAWSIAWCMAVYGALYIALQIIQLGLKWKGVTRASQTVN